MMRGFAVATSSFQKGKKTLILVYNKHGNKTRNNRKLADEYWAKGGEQGNN